MRNKTYIGQETNQAILVKIKNAPELAKGSGVTGVIANALVPATTEAMVYSQAAGELKTALKEKGVEADVTVVEPSGWKPAEGNSHLIQDLAVGVGVLGVAAIAYNILFGGRR